MHIEKLHKESQGFHTFLVFLDSPEIQGEYKRLTPPSSIPWESLSWLEVACKGMYQVIIAVLLFFW